MERQAWMIAIFAPWSITWWIGWINIAPLTALLIDLIHKKQVSFASNSVQLKKAGVLFKNHNLNIFYLRDWLVVQEQSYQADNMEIGQVHSA